MIVDPYDSDQEQWSPVFIATWNTKPLIDLPHSNDVI
jgi:hypothetical protein